MNAKSICFTILVNAIAYRSSDHRSTLGDSGFGVEEIVGVTI
jgi:hypothetical protein